MPINTLCFTTQEGNEIIVKDSLFGDKSPDAPAASFVIQDYKKLLEKDKKLELHAITLSDYWRERIIPRGLRINKFPSFGKDNAEFRNKWEAILNKCSSDLMLLLIDEIKNERAEIRQSIEEVKQSFTTTLENDDTLATMLTQLQEDIDAFGKTITLQKLDKFKRDRQDYNQGAVYLWPQQPAFFRLHGPRNKQKKRKTRRGRPRKRRQLPITLPGSTQDPNEETVINISGGNTTTTSPRRNNKHCENSKTTRKSLSSQRTRGEPRWFGDRLYRQTTGTAMGAAYAPNYANLYMGLWEEQYIYNQTNPFRDNVTCLSLKLVWRIFQIQQLFAVFQMMHMCFPSFCPNTGKKNGKVRGAYKREYLNVGIDVDLDFAGPTIHGAGVAGYEGWLAGYQMTIDSAKSKMTHSNIAVGYRTGDFQLHTNVKDGSEFGGSIYQKVNDKLETAVDLAWSAGSNGTCFGIAAKYQLDPEASISAKVNNASLVGIGYSQNLRPG
ncbi:hypothetical protein WMY93_012905 [Mugilogobius chulae]|uniref:Non-selective voltage-gated ion channel VDAC2 n=1 Tax=Mugilogobius chulae TaxID=88201 RepID=A0AAW0P1Z5_9GOBI